MAGTLSATIIPASVSQNVTATLSGDGALGTAAMSPVYAMSTAFTGTAALSATGTASYSRSAALTGTGAFTETYSQKYAPTIAFAASGTLSAAMSGTVTGIQLISTAAAASSTVAMPTHQTGDMILVVAWRDGSTTAPTLPGGYFDVTVDTGTSCSSRLSYKFAQSSSETVGTWTSATGVAVAVYRNVVTLQGPFSDFQTGSGSTITYPAHSFSYRPAITAGSWFVRAAGHRSATNLLTNTPAGYVQRAGTATENRIIDTNTVITTAPTAATQSVNASSGWIAYTGELIRADVGAAFSDNFNTGSVPDPALWLPYSTDGAGSATLVGGRLRLTVGTGDGYRVDTLGTYTLVNRSLTFQIANTTFSNTDTAYNCAFGYQSNYIFIGRSDGESVTTHKLQRQLNGVDTTIATRTFTVGDWYRLTQSGGTITAETSTNGTTWSSWASTSIGPNTPPSGFVRFYATNTLATSSYIEFDNVTLT